MTIFTRVLSLAVLGMMISTTLGNAADIDRTAVDFKTPSDIKWVRNAAGTNESAVLFGDPSKPALRRPYKVAARKNEPAALSSERPLLRRIVRHPVDGDQREI